MPGQSVVESARQQWQGVFRRVNKAVVFADDAMAECLHWMGGAPSLLLSGAADIKQFSSFESGTESQHKAVFLISQPLFGHTERILADILRGSRFQYAIAVTSIPAALHAAARGAPVGEEDAAVFHQLEDFMRDCMGNQNYSSEVVYSPLTMAPITRGLFVLPAQHAVFPLLPHHWRQLYTQLDVKIPNPSPADLDASELPREFQRTVKLLAHSLNSVLEQLGVADDVYSLGHTSRLVATELANLSVARPRRKTSQQKASIVIVDRTVDLTSVLGHHGDTLLDKILAVNQPLPGHHNDVMVNMSPLCNIKSSCGDVILPGCLAHNTDHVSRELFEAMATATQKEALHELRLQLEEALAREEVEPVREADQSTAHFIHTNLASFRGDGVKLRQYSGLLQLLSATSHTLAHPACAHQGSLLGIEKGLLQSLSDDPSAPLSQVSQLLDNYIHSPHNERTQSLEDVLGLLAYVYSLYPDEDLVDTELEQQLKPLLVRALMETSRDQLPACVLHLLAGGEVADSVTQVVSALVRTLRSLTTTRQHLKTFRQTYEEGGVMSQAALTPVLEQLTREIFTPGSKQEVPDLEYQSTGFRDLLKSGFGLFMNVSKPRPNDHPLLIIFVVGGVSSSEVKLIQQTVSKSNTTTQVIMGSTRLVTPGHVVQQLFSHQVPR